MTVQPDPVDDGRLRRLHVAATAILLRGEAHTPLERRWAREVLDLTAALRSAREELERLRHAHDPPGGASPSG